MTGGTNGDDELGLKDVTFLRAIRDVNGSPERYGAAEAGVTPATVSAVAEATTLTEPEVRARLDDPRLGNGELVTVYEDPAGRRSAELTEAGERAIESAADGARAGDADRSAFDEMQAWEPAAVDDDGDHARSSRRNAATAGASRNADGEATADATPAPTEPSERTTEGTSSATADAEERLAALEERIGRLEAEAGSDSQPADDRVDDLAAEVAALRETTDRLESTLDRALDDLDAIRESEYGALDEKRGRQFETAVKSMVAFHQLATEVLDVRVENYEPAAGHADEERVETTRNRIADALGVGERGGGRPLEMGDESVWPDPEEVARGGRVFAGGAGGEEESVDTEQESDAPDSGVYPPIGGGDSSADSTDDAERGANEPAEATSDAPESGVYPPLYESGGEDAPADDGSAVDDTSQSDGDAGGSPPDSGVYPPIGERAAEGEPSGDEAASPPRDASADAARDGSADEAAGGSFPESLRPDIDAGEERVADAAGEESPVESEPNADDEPREPPLDVDSASARAVRDAVREARAEDDGSDTDREAYARVVGSTPVDGSVSAASDRRRQNSPSPENDD